MGQDSMYTWPLFFAAKALKAAIFPALATKRATGHPFGVYASAWDRDNLGG